MKYTPKIKEGLANFYNSGQKYLGMAGLGLLLASGPAVAEQARTADQFRQDKATWQKPIYEIGKLFGETLKSALGLTNADFAGSNRIDLFTYLDKNGYVCMGYQIVKGDPVMGGALNTMSETAGTTFQRKCDDGTDEKVKELSNIIEAGIAVNNRTITRAEARETGIESFTEILGKQKLIDDGYISGVDSNGNIVIGSPKGFSGGGGNPPTMF